MDKIINKNKVPKLRFGEFNNEWKEVKLKDLSTDISYGMNVPATDYDGENKYIRITDIDEETSLYTNNNVSPLGILDDKFLLKENDILFARTGASTGKTYLYDKKDGKLYYAGFLIKAHIKDNYIGKFIFEQTKLNKYYNWVRITSMRSGQPGINSLEYGNYKFAITSIFEQQKIANFFTLIDKKINLQTQKVELLKRYKKGLIEKLYNEKYNNKIKMKNIIKQKSIKNKNNEIKDIYSVNNKDGFILQSDQFKDRIVASEDTTNYKIIKKDYFAYNPARINVGSIARMKYKKIGIISPMYICFECKDNVLPEYLEYFFKTDIFTYEMKKRLEGSVRMCLSYESMLNIPIDLPDIIQQERISKVLNKFDKRINCEKIKYDYQKRLKDALLQKMFI